MFLSETNDRERRGELGRENLEYNSRPLDGNEAGGGDRWNGRRGTGALYRQVWQTPRESESRAVVAENRIEIAEIDRRPRISPFWTQKDCENTSCLGEMKTRFSQGWEKRKHGKNSHRISALDIARSLASSRGRGSNALVEDFCIKRLVFRSTNQEDDFMEENTTHRGNQRVS